MSSSSKFQFEFEGSVEGATSVILEGQYQAPCPCSLHVIQIICAAMVETLKGVGNEIFFNFFIHEVGQQGETLGALAGFDIDIFSPAKQQLSYGGNGGTTNNVRIVDNDLVYWY